MAKDVNKRKLGSPLPVKCVWGLICSLTSLDKTRNNLSLFNIIEQWNLPAEIIFQQGVKPLPLEHEIVTFWRRTISNFDEREISLDLEVILIDPEEKELSRMVVPLKLNSSEKRSRFIIQTNGLLVSIAGGYIYKINVIDSTKGESHHMLDIPFEILGKPTQAAI